MGVQTPTENRNSGLERRILRQRLSNRDAVGDRAGLSTIRNLDALFSALKAQRQVQIQIRRGVFDKEKDCLM